MARLRLLFAVSLIVGGVAVATVAAPSASAYGSNSQYQVGLSASFPGGGLWGWFVFNSDGSAEAALTFCSHGNGASHANVDFTWTTGPAQPQDINYQPGATTQPLTFYTVTSDNPGFLPPNIDLGIPVMPGHYSSHPAPGVANNIQVTLIPKP